MLSGGVSKGKFDFIPGVLAQMGVKEVFHRVFQRPGKPFWFGYHPNTRTTIFSFPGNPVSTFVCYHAYFKDWLRKSMGLHPVVFEVVLNEDIQAHPELTRFLNVRTVYSAGYLSVELVKDNGSGDLTVLAEADGFVRLDPSGQSYKKGNTVPFLPTRRIV
jgi:molybdopterin molybdotransferase